MVISPTRQILREVFSQAAEANPDLQILLEKLQMHMKEEPEEHCLVGSNELCEVLFQVRLDGFSYQLTRSYAPESGETVNLSGREREITRLVAKGLPNKMIAAVLEISPWTVSTHLRRIFTKLGVSTRAEMVAYVLKEGLLAENQSNV